MVQFNTSQKLFNMNQLKKGPSFHCMQNIATPTQAMEQSSVNLKLCTQRSESIKATPQIVAPNQMANYKSSLIPTQRTLARSGSTKNTQH